MNFTLLDFRYRLDQGSHYSLRLGQVAMRHPSATEAAKQSSTPEASSEPWVKPAFVVYSIDDVTEGGAIVPADNDGFAGSS
jgi:hypothetical protein